MPEQRRDWTWLPLCLLPPALIGTLYGWAVLVSTAIHPGWVGLNHIALGTDWMVFYGAIRSVLDGHLSLIMNGDDFTAYLNHTMADWPDLSSSVAQHHRFACWCRWPCWDRANGKA